MKKITINTAAIAAALILTVGFSACKKHEKDNPTPNTPTYTYNLDVTSPEEAHTYMHGDTVWINATATTDGEFHGYEIVIRDKSDNAELFSTDEHAHGQTINIHEFWINNVTQHTSAEVEINAVKDHDGNTVTKKIDIHCMP